MRTLISLLVGGLLLTQGLVGAARAQETAPPRYGDVNGDERVDVSDVRDLLASIVMGTPPPSAERADVAPLREDGTFGDGSVDLGDAVRLLRYVAGQHSGPWPGVFAYDFTASLQGWSPDGIDLDEPPAEWSIEHATDPLIFGQGYARYFLDNLTDAGKIWLERPFAVAPNTPYRVTVSFRFGTSDWGDLSLWSIIGAASPTDLEEFGQFRVLDDTRNGGTDALVWLDKSYTLEAASDARGVLWVGLGLWGTFEVARAYFVDDLRVSLEPLPASVPEGSISGTVLQPEGVIVAAVPKVGKGQEPRAYFAQPDPQTGAYSIQGLPSGEYTVYASSDGARPWPHRRPIVIDTASEVGRNVAGIDFDLADLPSTPKQVQEALSVPRTPGTAASREDLPIHPDLSNPEGPAKLDVTVENQEGGTARVSLTFRYPRTEDIQIDEILDVIELKVWSGETLVDYVPIVWEEVSAEPLNPGDTLHWTQHVRIPSADSGDYRLEVVLWGNYE